MPTVDYVICMHIKYNYSYVCVCLCMYVQFYDIHNLRGFRRAIVEVCAICSLRLVSVITNLKQGELK